MFFLLSVKCSLSCLNILYFLGLLTKSSSKFTLMLGTTLAYQSTLQCAIKSTGYPMVASLQHVNNNLALHCNLLFQNKLDPTFSGHQKFLTYPKLQIDSHMQPKIIDLPKIIGLIFISIFSV